MKRQSYQCSSDEEKRRKCGRYCTHSNDEIEQIRLITKLEEQIREMKMEMEILKAQEKELDETKKEMEKMKKEMEEMKAREKEKEMLESINKKEKQKKKGKPTEEKATEQEVMEVDLAITRSLCDLAQPGPSKAPATGNEIDLGFNVVQTKKQKKKLREAAKAQQEAQREKEPTPERKIKPKIPTIHIETAKGWPEKLQKLSQKNLYVETRRSTNGGLTLAPKSEEQHRGITKFLTEEGMAYHTVRLQSDKPAKMVLKNVPEEYTIEEIKEDLKRQQCYPSKVARLTSRGQSKKTLPLVFVEVPKGDEDTVKEVNDIHGSKISVEKLRNKGILQCYRCQGFNHAQGTCTMGRKCVFCGGNHRQFECPQNGNENAKPKCGNCSGQHPANYRGCPKMPRTKPRKRTTPYPALKRDGVSYARCATGGKVAANPTPEMMLAFRQMMEPMLLEMFQQIANKFAK